MTRILSPRGSKKPDHRHCGLLRAPCERPGGRRTAHHFDEIAPSHAALPGASDRAKRSRRIAQVSRRAAVHRKRRRKEWPMTALGLGCAKTPAVAPHVEISPSNCIPESQIILHTRSFSLRENCVFYILRMYEFLHNQGQIRSSYDVRRTTALTS